jgi:SAM-dependent methyltransferase
MDKQSLQSYFDSVASQRSKWRKRNRSYHKLLEKYFSFMVPKNAKVLEIGCGTGDLLASLKPSRGIGVDFSSKIIEIAKSHYPDLNFFVQDAEKLEINEKFDYVILSDLVGSLWDVQAVFDNLQNVCHKRTRVIVSYYNYIWEPVMRLGEIFKLKLKQPLQNWLSSKDIINILSLTGFETIRTDKKIMFPKYLPVFSWFVNGFVANLPLLRTLSLTNFIIARPIIEKSKEYSVSIIIPARNEKGNIENAILQTPEFGSEQEFIYVEGHSTDGTYEEILRIKEKYPLKNIKVIKQSGVGKGNAVREGFDIATP